MTADADQLRPRGARRRRGSPSGGKQPGGAYGEGGGPSGSAGGAGDEPGGGEFDEPVTARPTRFFGSVEIDASRPIKSLEWIVTAVVEQLQRTHGTKVRLEFEAEAPARLDENDVCIVWGPRQAAEVPGGVGRVRVDRSVLGAPVYGEGAGSFRVAYVFALPRTAATDAGAGKPANFIPRQPVCAFA